MKEFAYVDSYESTMREFFLITFQYWPEGIFFFLFLRKEAVDFPREEYPYYFRATPKFKNRFPVENGPWTTAPVRSLLPTSTKIEWFHHRIDRALE